MKKFSIINEQFLKDIDDEDVDNNFIEHSDGLWYEKFEKLKPTDDFKYKLEFNFQVSNFGNDGKVNIAELVESLYNILTSLRMIDSVTFTDFLITEPNDKYRYRLCFGEIANGLWWVRDDLRNRRYDAYTSPHIHICVFFNKFRKFNDKDRYLRMMNNFMELLIGIKSEIKFINNITFQFFKMVNGKEERISWEVHPLSTKITSELRNIWNVFQNASDYSMSIDKFAVNEQTFLDAMNVAYKNFEKNGYILKPIKHVIISESIEWSWASFDFIPIDKKKSIDSVELEKMIYDFIIMQLGAMFIGNTTLCLIFRSPMKVNEEKFGYHSNSNKLNRTHVMYDDDKNELYKSEPFMTMNKGVKSYKSAIRKITPSNASNKGVCVIMTDMNKHVFRDDSSAYFPTLGTGRNIFGIATFFKKKIVEGEAW